MPCFKGIKRGMPGLGAQVFGYAEMKIGIGLPPDQQEGNVGAPELDQTGRIGGDLVR